MVGIDTTRRLTAAACFLSLLQLGDRIGNRTVKGCLWQVFRGSRSSCLSSCPRTYWEHSGAGNPVNPVASGQIPLTG